MKKVLFICLGGLGNLLMLSPTIKRFREAHPKAEIALLYRKPFASVPFRGSGIINDFWCLNGNFISKAKLLYRLGRKKYDVSVTGFPSNRWQYNLIAKLINAKRRVTHQYRVGKIRTLSFLQNSQVEAVSWLHDIEQNMFLLRNSEMLPSPFFRNRKPYFHLTQKDWDSARNILEPYGPERKFFGIHFNRGNQQRNNWGGEVIKEFADVIDKIATHFGYIPILFTGPENNASAYGIYERALTRPLICAFGQNFKTVAALIGSCEFLINTDSGLGHIASAMDTKSFTVFSCANPKRVLPYGSQAKLIPREEPCLYCYKYPMDAWNPKIKCHNGFSCLKTIEPEQIIETVKKYVKS